MNDYQPARMDPAPTLPSVFSETHKNVAAHAWTHTKQSHIFPTPGAYAGLDCDAFLDPTVDTWLQDHKPTWTVPALPAMLILDVVMRVANDFLHEPVHALQSLDLTKALPLTGPYALRCDPSFGGHENDELHISIHAMPIEHHAQRAQFEKIGTAVIGLDLHDQERPALFVDLDQALEVDELTVIDERTCGPTFPLITSLKRNHSGASAVLTASHCPMRDEIVHIALLEAALQAIPRDQLSIWAPNVRRDAVSHTRKVLNFQHFERAVLSEPIEVRVEFCGYERDIVQFPMFDIQLTQDTVVLSTFRVVDEVTTVAPLADLSPVGRRNFLRDRMYLGGVGISSSDDSVTRLRIEDVQSMDWLAGTIAEVYGLQSDDHAVEIAVRDHIARRTKHHPALIELADDLRSGHAPNAPTDWFVVDIKRNGNEIIVSDSAKRPTSTASRRHRAHRSNFRHA